MAPPQSFASKRLLQRLLVASRPTLAAGAALGVALACSAPAMAQSPRSVLGLASCPPPPGEHYCHPGGDARLLWVYDLGTAFQHGWSIGNRSGISLLFNEKNRLISPKNPQIVQVELVYPFDAPICPATWSTQQPPCHPHCRLGEGGYLGSIVCDPHLVQFLSISDPAYKQLSRCPPPPGESRCAIQGSPGWIEIHPEPTPLKDGWDRGVLPSMRLGAGPVWFKAPGSSERTQSGSFEFSLGGIHLLRSLADTRFTLHFPVDLGYAHDWGDGYRGHAFLAGAGAGVLFNGHSISYVPRLSLGSRGGFSPGIRHGLRYSIFFSFSIELQHQYLSTPTGGSNHLGVLFGLDIVRGMISGRPLLVESDSRVASLTACSTWA